MKLNHGALVMTVVEDIISFDLIPHTSIYEAKWLRKLRQRICTLTTVQILEACKTISILRFFEFSIEDFTTCRHNNLMVDGSNAQTLNGHCTDIIK